MPLSYFTCKLFYKANISPNFRDDSKNYIEKFKIKPNVFIAESCDFFLQCKNTDDLLKQNEQYKKISSDNFVSSILDIAAYTSLVSLTHNHIAIVDLDFSNLNVFFLINDLLPKYLDKETVDNINDVYKKINHAFKDNVLEMKIGDFFYNDFCYNEMIIGSLLRHIFYTEEVCKYFIVYNYQIIFFGEQLEDIQNYIKVFFEHVNPYGLENKKTTYFNVRTDDIIFANNLIFENGKGEIKKQTIDLFHWQIKNNVQQIVYLSSKTENLLMQEMELCDLNRIKNGYKNNAFELFKRQYEWLRYIHSRR